VVPVGSGSREVTSLGVGVQDDGDGVSVVSCAEETDWSSKRRTDGNRIEHECSRAMGGLRFFLTDDGFLSDPGDGYFDRRNFHSVFLRTTVYGPSRPLTILLVETIYASDRMVTSTITRRMRSQL
jgi:hypothetical protein